MLVSLLNFTLIKLSYVSVHVILGGYFYITRSSAWWLKSCCFCLQCVYPYFLWMIPVWQILWVDFVSFLYMILVLPDSLHGLLFQLCLGSQNQDNFFGSMTILSLYWFSVWMFICPVCLWLCKPIRSWTWISCAIWARF